MKKLILFVFLFSFYLSNAQNFNDNLSGVINFIKFYANSIEYKTKSFDTSVYYIDRCINIAEKYSFVLLSGYAYYLKGQILDYYALYDSSYVYYKKSLNFLEKGKDSLLTAKALLNIGVSDYYYGEYDSAISAYSRAKNFLTNSNDYLLRGKIENNLALVAKAQGNYKKAIENFYTAMEFYEKTENEKSIANIYHNLGVLYWERKNFEKSLESFQAAEKIYKKYGNQNDIADVYSNIGMIYANKNDSAKAMEYFDKAIYLYSFYGNKAGLGTALTDKAGLLDDYGFHNEAELLYKQALNLFEQINYSKGIFVCKTNLSRFLLKRNNPNAAIKLLNEVFDNIEKQPAFYAVEAYSLLAESYKQNGNLNKAYFFLKKYGQAKDSLFNLQKNKEISELLIAYETEKKQKQIILLEKNAEIQQIKIYEKDKRIKTFSLITVIISLLLILIFVLYLQKKASYLALVNQNVKLTQIEIEKEKEQQISTNKNIKNNKIIDENTKSLLLKKLNNLMEKEKIFLNNQLTINEVAKKLNTNRNYLSQLINTHFKTNFNNFINEFRIKEAKKLLLNSEYKNYTIEGIGKTVGFHSKATFNNAFKKFTGVTPSFFRKNALNIL